MKFSSIDIKNVISRAIHKISTIKPYFSSMSGFINKVRSKLNVSSSKFILFATIYFGSWFYLLCWKYGFEATSKNSFRAFIFYTFLMFFNFTPAVLLLNLIVLPYIVKPLIAILLIISGFGSHMIYNYGPHIRVDLFTSIFRIYITRFLSLMTFNNFLYILFTVIIPSIIVFFIKINYSSPSKEIKNRAIFVGIWLLIVAIFALVTLFCLSYK